MLNLSAQLSLIRVPLVVAVLSQSTGHVHLREEPAPALAGQIEAAATTGEESEAASPVLPVVEIAVDGAAIERGRETAGVMRIVTDHDGSLRDLADRPVAVESNVSIEIHGESSAGLAKKSFRFELQDANGKDRALPLLGLPAGTDWVLHGCGADRTCLRNVLAYSLGREFGRYAPRTRFVELRLDGDYRGLYVLVERIRRDPARVDLPRPAGTAAEGDITGGYIFKMDLGEGSPADRIPRDWVSQLTRTVYSYSYPRFNQITTGQKAYLHDYVRGFEQAMQTDGWNDPGSGYRRWIDVPSWVDFALMQELSVNPDAYFKSVYLQKLPESRGNRLALGPIWDFDLAFGAAEFRDARNTRAWAHEMNRFGSETVAYDPPGTSPFVPPFWERLWSDPAFQADLRCRWQTLRQGPLRTGALLERIDGWAAQLSLAQPRDGALWGSPPANAFAEEVRSLQDFLVARTAWMDANLPGRCG